MTHAIRGGQIWHAPWPLCWTLYMISGRNGFLAVTDPREQGSMVWESAGMGGEWHPGEWWESYFMARGYKLEGQLKTLLNETYEYMLSVR